MKIIFFSALMLLQVCTFVVHAQETPKAGTNKKSTSIDKYQGTWIWAKEDDTIRIFLKKENLEFLKDIRSDALIGFHEYKKSNKVIESSFKYKNTSYSDKHSTILLIEQNGSNVLEGSLKDISKNKNASVELKLNQANNILQLKLSNREGIRIGKFDADFTLPKSIILRKE